MLAHGHCSYGTRPNNSFKPNPLRYTNNLAGKACHVVGSATRVGLTQALEPMSNFLRTTIFILLAIAAGPIFACTFASPSEELAREGKNILVGTVQGSTFVARPKGASTPALARTNSHSLARPELLVKVKKIEMLHGTAPPVVTAVSPCVLPVQVGDRVVVATYSGRRVAFPADWYEDSYRKVYGPGL